MKILILYASYGGGHISAANAIQEAIKKVYPNYEVELLDCMRYLNRQINYITVKSYEEMAKKTPKLWGKVYKASRKGPVAEISNSFNKIFSRKLGKFIRDSNPSVIISTHPFSTQMCGILKKKKKIEIPVATVMTDFKYHEQWLVGHEYLEKFFVSNEKMKQSLIDYGVDKRKIFAEGMPISEKFSEKFNRNEILNEFDLKSNLKTVLFFAGGKMGLARSNIFKFMEVFAKNADCMQVVAISGKNPKVYEKFKEIAKNKNNIKVIQFTNKVPELMSVSDIVVTKPRWHYVFRGSNKGCAHSRY